MILQSILLNLFTQYIFTEGISQNKIVAQVAQFGTSPCICADPEHSVREGVPVNVCLVLMYFTEGRTNLPWEAIGPEGSTCFSSVVSTSISKEPYNH